MNGSARLNILAAKRIAGLMDAGIKEATMPREVEQVLQQLLEDAKRMRERAGK